MSDDITAQEAGPDRPAVFPEQEIPTISTPEELIERGEMPQIPIEKTERVPEGWMPFLVGAVEELRKTGVSCTDRTLTLVQARQWTKDEQEPDRPRTVLDRVALFGIAGDEGLEPERWVVASQDLHAGNETRAVEIGDVTQDEAAALGAYTRTVRLLDAINRG